MLDFNTLFKIVRIPVIFLTALTGIGIIINFFNILLLIIGWWVGVLLLCALCSLWAGYQATRKYGLGIVDAGLAGTVVWAIPGAFGLTVSAITSFMTALFWGSIAGFEVLAFLGGALAVVIVLVIGSIIAFVIGAIGGFFGQKK